MPNGRPSFGRRAKAAAAQTLALSLLVAAGPRPAAAEPSRAALAEAGRQATLRDIDYGEDHCDAAMRVEAWLQQRVGAAARRIEWAGGPCRLVHDLRPGIDASSWPYCAQATITLARPKDKDDTPVVEIYLEKPSGNRPGKAYAFRAVLATRDDGPDYIRFRRDFESLWDERFPPDPAEARCQD